MSRASLAVALVAGAALLVAGCADLRNMMGGSSSSSPPPQPQLQPQPTQGPAPSMQSAQPARMGTEPAHRIMETSVGKVLATNRGMTLYTTAGDTMPGMSMCNDACAGSWPPLLALDDAVSVGRWTVVQRSNGMKQWAYDGKPLYGWREDRRPGDVAGDGRLNGAWRAARP